MFSAGESPNPNGAYSTVVNIQVNTSTEVDIKSPGNVKKRVHGKAESYFSQKLSLLCIFVCALYTNLLTVRMHTFVTI